MGVAVSKVRRASRRQDHFQTVSVDWGSEVYTCPSVQRGIPGGRTLAS